MSEGKKGKKDIFLGPANIIFLAPSSMKQTEVTPTTEIDEIPQQGT